MDAVKLLEQQHRELERLFGELKQTGDPGRKELFLHLSDLLQAHLALGERLFYPEVLDRDSRDKLQESVSLQLRMKRLLVELLDLDPSDEHFDSLCGALERDVASHIALEEEKGLFQAAFDSLGRRALGRLGEEMSTLDQLLRDGIPA